MTTTTRMKSIAVTFASIKYLLIFLLLLSKCQFDHCEPLPLDYDETSGNSNTGSGASDSIDGGGGGGGEIYEPALLQQTIDDEAYRNSIEERDAASSNQKLPTTEQPDYHNPVQRKSDHDDDENMATELATEKQDGMLYNRRINVSTPTNTTKAAAAAALGGGGGGGSSSSEYSYEDVVEDNGHTTMAPSLASSKHLNSRLLPHENFGNKKALHHNNFAHENDKGNAAASSSNSDYYSDSDESVYYDHHHQHHQQHQPHRHYNIATHGDGGGGGSKLQGKHDPQHKHIHNSAEGSSASMNVNANDSDSDYYSDEQQFVAKPMGIFHRASGFDAPEAIVPTNQLESDGQLQPSLPQAHAQQMLPAKEVKAHPFRQIENSEDETDYYEGATPHNFSHNDSAGGSTEKATSQSSSSSSTSQSTAAAAVAQQASGIEPNNIVATTESSSSSSSSSSSTLSTTATDSITSSIAAAIAAAAAAAATSTTTTPILIPTIYQQTTPTTRAIATTPNITTSSLPSPPPPPVAAAIAAQAPAPLLPSSPTVTMMTTTASAPKFTTTTTTITTTTTVATPTTQITTTRPFSKQPKVIHTPTPPPKPELLPEQLRNYIKDVYIRMPLAVIIDPSAETLEKTKVLYNDALHGKSINVGIVLVTLNDSSNNIPTSFSFNNTHEFLAVLNGTKEHECGDIFNGIMHAAELVPYDSAIFISTAVIAPHTELVQDAAITLLKKRIRLFLLWYGEQITSENETEETVGGILGEVAIRSGGEIIHIVGSKNAQEIDGGTLTLIANSYIGSQELDVPVDTTMSSLHVKIDAPMRRATMDTPNGEINLKKLVKFKPLARSKQQQQQQEQNKANVEDEDYSLDAYIPLNKLRKATTFKLKLIPELDELNRNYYVFLRAERKADHFLGDVIKRFEAYFMGRRQQQQQQQQPPQQYQEVQGREASSHHQIETHARLRFPAEQTSTITNTNIADYERPKTEVETFSETEVRNDIGGTNHTATTVSIVTPSSSPYGNSNQRTALLLSRCGTKIEMGAQSQLLMAPGTMGQLLFEVTNMRSEVVFYNIQVTDERRFLLRLMPQSLQLRPLETATISLTVLIPTGTAQGTIDRITFTTHGKETTSLSLVLKVVNSIDAEDTTGPTITWEFGNRCHNIATEAINCAERFWTLDIMAQDWQSGILRLQTTPSEGLFYRNSYTVGSSDLLKASYMATCCEPKVSLLAYDAAGNQRAYNIDVRDIVLTEASIAAISLGAILLLLLLIILIAGIVWCCRRRKVSLELPTYRSHSTRSME